MKKVVHVADSGSRLAGGMFESVRGLCRGVGAQGTWAVTAVAREDRFAVEDAKAWSATPLALAEPSRFWWLGTAQKMARIIHAEKPDVIHLHGIWGVASLAVSFFLARRDPFRPRLIVSPRGMLDPWAMAHSRWKKTLAWRAWVGGVLRSADCLHALCGAEASAIASLLPGQDIRIIPNAVDLPSPLASEAYGREKMVLFLGRIHSKKGIATLLSAWRMLGAQRSRGWRLVIAGWDDGGHEAALKQQVRNLGLCGSVSFFGPAVGADKEQLFRKAAVFVLPSFSEGLPMAVLEAWSYGVPTVITDACNLPEGYDAGAAIRVEPVPESVAAGLVRMLDEISEPERRSMGARARGLIAQKFCWALAGVEMVRVYEELTSRTSAHL